MNEILGPRFEQAIAYAALLHADQRRKGGDIPYLAHLMAVHGLIDVATTQQMPAHA